MKKIIKILFLIVIILLITLLCMLNVLASKCSRSPIFDLLFYGVTERCDTYESEYFIYQVPLENRQVAYIIGLTELGKEQEYLIVPETIDNKKVTEITNFISDPESVKKLYGDTINVNYESTKRKKIFIISNVKATSGLVTLFYREEVFYLDNDSDYPYSCFVTNIKGRGKPFYDFSSGRQKFSANVSYFYNYENAKNDGYYWIDNYAYGEKIEYIPENPTRDGYTFDGWYKESECINKWNFETDTLPEEKYNEEERKVYQETMLYAKWIEN